MINFDVESSDDAASKEGGNLESRGGEVIISVRSGLGTRKSKREREREIENDRSEEKDDRSIEFPPISAKVIRTNDVSNRRESIGERF